MLAAIGTVKVLYASSAVVGIHMHFEVYKSPYEVQQYKSNHMNSYDYDMLYL